MEHFAFVTGVVAEGSTPCSVRWWCTIAVDVKCPSDRVPELTLVMETGFRFYPMYDRISVHMLIPQEFHVWCKKFVEVINCIVVMQNGLDQRRGGIDD